jgi:hypothetical protein
MEETSSLDNKRTDIENTTEQIIGIIKKTRARSKRFQCPKVKRLAELNGSSYYFKVTRSDSDAKIFNSMKEQKRLSKPGEWSIIHSGLTDR